MTTEVYVSLNGLDYNRLDLMKSETILMKYIYKDTQDLSKIYSPYSQSFALQGSLNNQKILGFLGETKILKSKANNVFYCKIYNNGLLAKKGLLKVTEARYERGRIKSFTANFTTGLLSLKDRMGEDKLVDLPSTPYTIEWTNISVKNYMQEGVNNNGVLFNFIIPFISNSRIWQTADINDTKKLDNITYNPIINETNENYVKVNELSPAIQFRTIIDLIKSKYNLDIIMPLETEDFYNDLYVYCNKLEGSFLKEVYYDIVNINNYYAQGPNLYLLFVSSFTDVFTIKSNINIDNRFTPDQLFFNVAFFNVENTKSNEDVEIRITIEGLDGAEYGTNSNIIPNGGSSTDMKVSIPVSLFSANEYFSFKVKVKASSPITWVNSYAEIFYYSNFNFRGYRLRFLSIQRYTNNNSSAMGMSKIDLFKSLPDMKVVDFLTSFFKTFNISIFETAPDDGRVYWLTPKDIKAQNKEYSSSEADYTDYVIDDKQNKKIANDYNYYNFKHKKNKYYSNEIYLRDKGREYGQLTYPSIKPTKDLSEFKIETEFSIVPQSKIISNTRQAIPTIYGFTSEKPTLAPNNALRYKPNTEDLTLFFYNGRFGPRNPNLGYLNVYPDGVKVTEALYAITTVGSIHNKSGFNLGFGLIETATNESLYENYYKDQTERLLEPNTLQSTFTLELPPTELVLNYANTGQGQSKVPSGFRLQNDIIIGETRYSIIDATIDQTTGKTTLNLLNYV